MTRLFYGLIYNSRRLAGYGAPRGPTWKFSAGIDRAPVLTVLYIHGETSKRRYARDALKARALNYSYIIYVLAGTI